MKTQARTQDLIEKDKRYLWHPFTQMQEWRAEDQLVIERGEGCYVFDTEGRRYIDGVSSLWCNVHGHRKKEIDDAVRDQLEKIAHSTFLGLTHEPGILLAEKLVQIAPHSRGVPPRTDIAGQDAAWPSAGRALGSAVPRGRRGAPPTCLQPTLTRVFYSDSGSEAVEIALKIAYQYWALRGEKKRKKFVKLGEAYHGDTVGAVSVGGIDLFHEVYGPLLFETFKIPSPYCYFCRRGLHGERCAEKSLAELERVLKSSSKEICAVVMEPLIQGAAGMLVQPSGYISRVRELTLRYNTLLIFDEVATGFGRTGKMFAAEHENVAPDMMTVAKGLTGGYLPLAATLTTEEIYSAFLGRFEEFKQFFHGHTFTGNPLACRAALASLEIFERENVLENLQAKIEFLTNCYCEDAPQLLTCSRGVPPRGLRGKMPRLRDELCPRNDGRGTGTVSVRPIHGSRFTIYDLPHVGDIRQCGVMMGIELLKDPETRTPFPVTDRIGKRVILRARELGAILRPLGDVIVLMPPLSMPMNVLEELAGITHQAIKDVTD